MDPLSVTASVLAVIGAIGTVTTTATKFMRDFQSSRKEIVAVKKELASLKAVVEILADDFGDATSNSSSTTLPEHVLQQVAGISENCLRVVNQIGDCLVDCRNSRLRWAATGKSEIQRLQADLEVNKSALSITLDLVSVLLLRDVKNDTEHIIEDTTVIKGDTAQMRSDLDLILTEISRMQVQLQSRSTAIPADTSTSSDFLMERFLGELRTDAETVLGDVEDLSNGRDFEDHEDYDSEFKPADRTPSKPEEDAPDNQTIVFTNTLGRRFQIPFSSCKTWEDMSKLVRESYQDDSDDVVDQGRYDEIINGRYDLLSPDGQIILQSLWEKLVKPGWEVKMQMWKKCILYDVPVGGEKEENPVIKFRDAVGRKFSFPLSICSTWQGMEDLINSAFQHDMYFGGAVRLGFYDVVIPEPNYEVIKKSSWEERIKPGMQVGMVMWPLPSTLPSPPPPPQLPSAPINETVRPKRSDHQSKPRGKSKAAESTTILDFIRPQRSRNRVRFHKNLSGLESE
ncbi:hypothetical protein QBC35DRAFT_254503 [Podospora australis]|uniref:Fungal N-terminal domain-containing protein n=1 Tax=Podospora australis TaxID=1536484 RepID=A0AAN6WRF2_9PEZI|nr:hypothetical protein QBC35DRAFT_254503 [Podospora australis]